MPDDTQETADKEKIIAGSYVKWKRDFEFFGIHQGQITSLINRYGYGPFLVKSVKGDDGKYPLVVISTPNKDAEVSACFLQKVRTFSNPEDAIAAMIDMATD